MKRRLFMYGYDDTYLLACFHPLFFVWVFDLLYLLCRLMLQITVPRYSERHKVLHLKQYILITSIVSDIRWILPAEHLTR